MAPLHKVSTVPYTVNIGTDKRITPNFAENSPIYIYRLIETRLRPKNKEILKDFEMLKDYIKHKKTKHLTSSLLQIC